MNKPSDLSWLDELPGYVRAEREGLGPKSLERWDRVMYECLQDNKTRPGGKQMYLLIPGLRWRKGVIPQRLFANACREREREQQPEIRA